MKIKSIMFQVGLLSCCAFVANAGSLDFVRDQLGVDTTNFVFDSPPPASPQFRRVSSKPGAEEWVYTRSHKVTTNAPFVEIRLSYTSNKLDAIEISTFGKERNDKLAIEFYRLSSDGGTKRNPVREDPYLLSYEGMCNPTENFAARFRLTTIAAEIRRQKAEEARLAGPPYFTFGLRNSGSVGDELRYATLSMVREGGPASEVSLQKPSGIIGQIKLVSASTRDDYELAFKPEGKGFLPKSWRFSVSYIDRDRKQQQQTFEFFYQPPDKFAVTETHE